MRRAVDQLAGQFQEMVAFVEQHAHRTAGHRIADAQGAFVDHEAEFGSGGVVGHLEPLGGRHGLEEETGLSTGFESIGFIELAADSDRVEEYRRRLLDLALEFIDDDELEGAQRRNELRTSDLIREIMDVPGVSAVRTIVIAAENGAPKAAAKTSKKDKRLSVERIYQKLSHVEQILLRYVNFS